MYEQASQAKLYDPRFEHDACGIGAVVNVDGHADHAAVDQALRIVEKLEHRAGRDASGETGDGVGIMTQVPHAFFSREAAALGISLGGARDYGVGMFFFPQEKLERSHAKKLFEVICAKEGLTVPGWRDVPVCPEILGARARGCMPYIAQCFVKRPAQIEKGIAFDRALYIVRREFEQSVPGTYVVSLSSRTIVYKGMFLVHQLRRFYPDLQDESYASALAMVHSRFSTNTNPSWERAHPNRLLLHNGEINTIRGNIDRMLAREETMSAPVFENDMEKVYPVVNPAGSDSAMLDNTLEFLMFSGIELPKAVMMTVPEPWAKNQDMPRAWRDMYHYYATMMEPWDGPAALLFSDGDLVGAALDRNGLRPLRYYVVEGGRLVLSSEVGVLEFAPQQVLKKGRLSPGKMLVADTVSGRLLTNDEIKNRYAAVHPYGEWLDRGIVRLDDLPLPNHRARTHTQQMRDKLYKAFGYTYEDLKYALIPMAASGAEPTTSMGIDIPLAVLSEKYQPLFNYFKQIFAQVTNPPIDSIRERIVTDSTVYVGSDGNILEDRPDNCRVLEIGNPILTGEEMMKIRALDMPGFKSEVISLLYYKNTSLEHALDRLFILCDKAYRSGANILILSDRGVDENHTAIPSLLAVSALEQYLVRTKKRTAVSVVLESAEPRDVHHFATLLAYGARAIYPYLAHECIGELIDKGLLDKDLHAAIESYNHAACDGVIKVASKMGVSTIQSYQSAQIFEIIGIRRDVVDRYFTNTVSRAGGIGLEEINEGVNFLHNKAFDRLDLPVDTTLDSYGFHQLRSGEGKEEHLYTPLTIHTLQRAVQTGNYETFRQYTELIDGSGNPHTLRQLLCFDTASRTPVPLEEVESEDAIVRRFKTGAMSYGSISQEAHECMAAAMNRLGGKSNTGEGGEDPSRFGTERNSAIKQVASARFGVTSAYLVSAKEIQIKMAQGAKPGEGGHLPGKKVYPWVARTRHATPGVSLISPPPHHDIYSIEDLAQLIFDLKNANTRADISVKLVSEAGVGTIAAGVAKAGAQSILISGYDGGTGAAPRTSIQGAGLPWELGLSEAHQTLVQNGLRTRVRLETDGKLMTGCDVAVACALGAEEFGFATAPLVSMGCVMMRVCNLDTCPMGIATQNAELRRRFCGKPEYVENFMRFIARQLREILASLGLRSVDELVGRSDLLKVRGDITNARAATVDMSRILNDGQALAQRFDPEHVFNFELEKTLDRRVLLAKMGKKLEKGEPACVSVRVSSTDRALGTIFGSEITRLHGDTLPDGCYTVRCTGSGGQSFGAFIPKGLTLSLCGDSNDYFGKGLSGGRLIVYPDPESPFKPEENIIIGNVALYGATGGQAYIRGIAGERFCVRNSGAEAVVEGVGDHGCEYMTGGCVVVLGPTGRNFAAGMSGGVAYVLDEGHDLYRRTNKELVSIEPIHDSEDIETLRRMLTAHYDATGSRRAQQILDRFPAYIPQFKKIVPLDYARMVDAIRACRKTEADPEKAEILAFNAVMQGSK